jgi:hypothetical protein
MAAAICHHRLNRRCKRFSIRRLRFSSDGSGSIE